MIWKCYVGGVKAIGFVAGELMGPPWHYRRQIRRAARFLAASAWCPIRKALIAAVIIAPLFAQAQMSLAQLTKRAEDHERRLSAMEAATQKMEFILAGRGGLQDQIDELTKEQRQTRDDVSDIKSSINTTLTVITFVVTVLGVLATWGRIAWQGAMAAAKRETGERPHV